MRFPDTFVIWGSMLVALLLTTMRLPEDVPQIFGWLRPEWAAIVLLYWVMAVPQQVGMVTAWVLGLFVDSVSGSLLGQHALGFVLIAFVGLSLYERLRMYSLLQQALIVFVTIGLAQVIGFWVGMLTRGGTWSLWILLPAVSSAVIWPLAFAFLRALRRRFRIV